MQPTQLLTELIHTITGPNSTADIQRRPRDRGKHPLDETIYLLNRLARKLTPFAAGTLLGFLGSVWLEHGAR